MPDNTQQINQINNNHPKTEADTKTEANIIGGTSTATNPNMSAETKSKTNPITTTKPHPTTNPNTPVMSQDKDHPKVSPQAYERLKRYVISAEHTNYDSIHVIPRAGKSGWHEIGDNSALMYYYSIIKDHVKKPKFKFDTFGGFYNHYEFGHIAVRDPDNIADALTAANIQFAKTNIDHTGHETKSPVHIVKYKLERTYTFKEIEKYTKAELTRREKAIHVPRATYDSPELYLDFTNFASILRHLCNRNFGKFTESISKDISTQMDSSLRAYLESGKIFSLTGDFEKSNPPLFVSGLEKIVTKYKFIVKTLHDLEISIEMAHIYQYFNAEDTCIACTSVQSHIKNFEISIQKLNQKINYIKSNINPNSDTNINPSNSPTSPGNKDTTKTNTNTNPDTNSNTNTTQPNPNNNHNNQ